MREIHLRDWLAIDGNTQDMAAEIIGCTQGAVSQMVKCEREIFFTIENGLPTSHYERKRPGRKKTAA